MTDAELAANLTVQRMLLEQVYAGTYFNHKGEFKTLIEALTMRLLHDLRAPTHADSRTAVWLITMQERALIAMESFGKNVERKIIDSSTYGSGMPNTRPPTVRTP